MSCLAGLVLVAAISAQSPSAPAAVAVPGSATLSPGQQVEYIKLPCGGPPPGGTACPAPPAELIVQYATGNGGTPTANVTLDASGLTVTAAAGFLVSVEGPTGSSCSSVAGESSSVHCPDAGVAPVYRPIPPVTFAVFPSQCPGTSPCAGALLARGWNLVAGSVLNTVTGIGPVYTFQAGDTQYQAVPPSSAEASLGYWVYLEGPFAAEVAGDGPSTISLTLPPAQFVMIGNPTAVSVSVAGADAVYVYDSTSGSYEPVLDLQPGQGAWAFSAAGAMITLLPAGTSSPSPLHR